MSQSSKSIQTGPCLCSRCFRISTCISYTYCPWDFQSGIFVLIFRSTEPAHKTLPVDFSVLSRSIVFLRLFLTGSQNQVSWGLIFLVQDLRVGAPNVKISSLILRGKTYSFIILLIVAHCSCSVVLSLAWPHLCICFSCLSQHCPFTLCCEDFSVFGGNYSTCRSICRFVVSRGGGTSGTSYASIYNSLL